MNSLTQMIVTALLKKGLVYESKDCDINLEIPQNGDDKQAGTIKVNVKANDIKIRIEKTES